MSRPETPFGVGKELSWHVHGLWQATEAISNGLHAIESSTEQAEHNRQTKQPISETEGFSVAEEYRGRLVHALAGIGWEELEVLRRELLFVVRHDKVPSEEELKREFDLGEDEISG